MEKVELITSVLSNPCAWEQQDWNKTKKHGKKVSRGKLMWKEAQWARKSPVSLIVQSFLISSSHISHSRLSVKTLIIIIIIIIIIIG